MSPKNSDIKTTLILPKKLHIKLKMKAVEKGLDLNDIFNIALRLLAAIVDAGRIPDDLGYMLQSIDSELLKQLEEVVK